MQDSRFSVFIFAESTIYQKEAMKQLKEIIMMLFAVTLFAACDIESSDVIWDIAPVQFNIFIADSEGHDLLDSTRQNNLIKEITVSYMGETYPVMTEREYNEKQYAGAQTRDYMPIFYGLILRQYWQPYHQTYDCYGLVFGEFNGEENVDKREIILNLPNQEPIHLAYKNSFKWKSNGDPQKRTQFYLNGQELKDDSGKSGYFSFRHSEAGRYEYVPNGTK